MRFEIGVKGILRVTAKDHEEAVEQARALCSETGDESWKLTVLGLELGIMDVIPVEVEE